MNNIVNEIMNEQQHLYKIRINHVSGLTLDINCCECFFAYDPETRELEIHKDTEEEREYLDHPLITINEEDIESWEEWT